MTVATAPPLRPLGIGELLDRAIRLYRQNFLKFIGIIAIMQIPLSALQLLTSLLTVSNIPTPFSIEGSGPPPDPADIFSPTYFIGIIGSLVLGIISFLLIQGVATAALTRAIAGSYLGESLGITEAYRKIGRAWLPLIGALILAILLSIVLGIWLLIPCVGWFTGIGILAFFWMVIVPLIAPVIVLEQQAATGAIRRAWDLARRRFWWVLGFVLILFIFSQLVITGPVTLITVGFQFAFGGNPFEFFTLQTIIQSVVGLLFSLIYLPLQLTAITLMYFDLRIRTEGFDLTVLSTSSSDSPAEFSELVALAPRSERGNLVTMNEMGYFVLVSLGAFVLYIILIFIFGGIGLLMMGAAGGPPGF